MKKMRRLWSKTINTKPNNNIGIWNLNYKRCMLFEHHVHITPMGTFYSFLGHARPSYEGIR